MKIPVFFNGAMNCASNNSYSPSAGKPKLAVGDWLSNPAIGPHLEVKSFTPVTHGQLCQVHDAAFIEGIADGTVKNGFGNTNREVYESLLHTNGSIVAASLHALKHGGLAVSPTSGFHHSRKGTAAGFCTFNGLILAVQEVIKELGKRARVMILDFDAHTGDGTQALIKDHSLQRNVIHVTAGQDYDTANEAMRCCNIMEIVKRCNLKWGEFPHLILYQAGADIWEHDDLGAGILTKEQMRSRDESIFKVAQGMASPIVTVLAGGYARDDKGTIEPVLALHRQTMQEAVMRFCY